MRRGRGPSEVDGVWRTEIALRVRELEHRLEMAREAGKTGREGIDESTFDAYAEAVKLCLDDARGVLDKPKKKRIQSWWRGDAITAAWDSVHGAEAALVAIAPAYDVLTPLPILRLWMRQVLGDSCKVETYERALEKISTASRALDRTFLRQVYRDTITANTERYKNLRAFRNVLFAVSGGLALALLVIGAWHAFDPGFVSLCSDGRHRFCFGGTHSAGDAVFQIALIGAAGGLLSSAFPLSKLENVPSRYDVIAPQIVLKVLAGASTALLGVLLLQADFVSLVEPSTDTELLAYAAVFGFSQQLLTQVVDKRAQSLLG